jgi:hypothetical protein
MPKRAKTSGHLWRCPKCDRGFANRNQSHFCGRHDLESHFVGKDDRARELYDALVRLLRRFGTLTVVPEKTRIAFQVRMSFAAISVRRSYLVGHLVLARRTEDPRFVRIETISPRNHVHHFRLTALEQLDAGFAALAEQAYAVGQQKHLPRSGTSEGSP